MKLSFLTAYWQDLIVANYLIDPSILSKHIPRGTELDLYEGNAYVSLVAFRFSKNSLCGIIPTIPYASFEEINLRFYIKHNNKRGVAFIKEVVPYKFIAGVARLLYQEPYVALPTICKKNINSDQAELSYIWGNQQEYSITARYKPSFNELVKNSFEEFILEHYWGYTPQADGSTIEYQVKHPTWNYVKIDDLNVSTAVSSFYGAGFEQVLKQPPDSAFIADGSKISVSFPRKFFHPLLNTTPKGWVLYDGACGFCAWWVPRWKKIINKYGYEIAPLQADWVEKKLELNKSELANDIRLLLNDDTLISGADAYIYAMKQTNWTLPFGYLLGLPGLRQLTWIFYKLFNRNRFLVSKVCRFRPEV